MKIIRKRIASAIVTIGFLAVVYFFTAWAFLLYSSAFEFTLYELGKPFGKAFFSAPFWYYFIVTLITVALAFICRRAHAFTKTDASTPTKKNQTMFAVLFALSVIMLLQPGISLFLLRLFPYNIGGVIYEPVLLMIRRVLSTRLSLEVVGESGVALQIPIAIANSILHQCLVFVCGYFFFNAIKLREHQPKGTKAAS